MPTLLASVSKHPMFQPKTRVTEYRFKGFFLFFFFLSFSQASSIASTDGTTLLALYSSSLKTAISTNIENNGLFFVVYSRKLMQELNYIVQKREKKSCVQLSDFPFTSTT